MSIWCRLGFHKVKYVYTKKGKCYQKGICLRENCVFSKNRELHNWGPEEWVGGGNRKGVPVDEYKQTCKRCGETHCEIR